LPAVSWPAMVLATLQIDEWRMAPSAPLRRLAALAMSMLIGTALLFACMAPALARSCHGLRQIIAGDAAPTRHQLEARFVAERTRPGESVLILSRFSWYHHAVSRTDRPLASSS